MRTLYFIVLSALIFTACKKTPPVVVKPVPIVDPVPSTIVSADTIKTGQYNGFVIGEPALSVYAKIQKLPVAQSNIYLTVVSNIFYNVDSLKTRLPLYSGFFLDEQIGTPTGLQFTFENDKVKSIYNNSGLQMGSWPSDTQAGATINVGDAVTDLYPKLVCIQQIARYAPKFQRISVFQKNLAKGFDPIMAASPQWYYTLTLATNKYQLTQYNFKNGGLTAIYISVAQY